MKNKIIIPTILFIAVLIFSFYVLSQEKIRNQIQKNGLPGQEIQQNNGENKGNQSASEIILFYGKGCPHCAVVEEYIKENNIQDKVSFVQKEVYYNQDNAKELLEKAKICGIPTNSIGVPFLWDGKNCLIGDRDIINFFKQKTNGQ
jgi:glutaredoxin